MDPNITIVIFFGVLAALIVGAACVSSKRGRAVSGVAALAWSFLMFSAARMVETFQLNAWYSASAHNLLDASASAIEAGHAKATGKELAKMRKELIVTYENRGNFKELADKTVTRLKNLNQGGDQQPEKPE